VAARDIVPVPGARFEETLASASPDVLREMIKGFAQRMMDADVEVRCNAGYGEVTPQRVNSRNGYRQREWDTLVGWPGGIAPPGSHRTEREPLGSLRSSHRIPANARTQVQCANSLGSRSRSPDHHALNRL
jgi:hypothetical protein